MAKRPHGYRTRYRSEKIESLLKRLFASPAFRRARGMDRVKMMTKFEYCMARSPSINKLTD